MAADLLKRPVGLQERDVAVRVVQVPLDHVAIIFRQRRHVHVGIVQIVKGLVVAEVVVAVVLVPSEEGVNIPDRPDELVLGLEGLGLIVLGRGGLSRLKELPLIVVVEVPPGVGAAGGVAVDVGLDAAGAAPPNRWLEEIRFRTASDLTGTCS